HLDVQPRGAGGLLSRRRPVGPVGTASRDGAGLRRLGRLRDRLPPGAGDGFRLPGRAAYFFRGFGFPLFAFAFLVWLNAVVDKRRNGAAVGWFYVMFTGGLPTLGSLVAVFMIPSFGGGFSGQKWTMIASTVIVAIGFCIAWFGVKERHGS